MAKVPGYIALDEGAIDEFLLEAATAAEEQGYKGSEAHAAALRLASEGLKLALKKSGRLPRTPRGHDANAFLTYAFQLVELVLAPKLEALYQKFKADIKRAAAKRRAEREEKAPKEPKRRKAKAESKDPEPVEPKPEG